MSSSAPRSLASGNFAAAMAWIADHGGVAEAQVCEAPRQGLHGPRLGLSGGAETRIPLRFVLPAGSLAQARRPAGGQADQGPAAPGRGRSLMSSALLQQSGPRAPSADAPRPRPLPAWRSCRLNTSCFGGGQGARMSGWGGDPEHA